MSDTSSFGYGQQDPNDSASDFNVITFIVRQMMARMSTMKLVRVTAVHSNGAVAAAGTVDVMPLVNQIDGSGNATPQGQVYGLPWYRLQGGANAVICDPQVGDIGYVVCSDRDISSVKANRAQSNPGSFRKFDVADGIYVGGCLSAAPDQYLIFTSSGIKIADKNGNVIETKSDGVHVTGTLFATNIQASGSVIAGSGSGDQVSLQTHKHGTGTAAAGTIAPTPGT